MNKKLSIFLPTLFFLLLISITVFAHPGRLDSNGGHWNHDTGEYHYHNGAHSSNNGSNYDSNDYDYDDDYYTATKEYTNISTEQSYSEESSTDNTSNSKEDDTMSNELLVFITVIILVILVIGIIMYKQNKARLLQMENQISRLLKDNEKIIKTTEEITQNDIEYTNGFNRGYDRGFNKASEDLTPQLIEKAYQLGINDADKIKKQLEERRKLFAQGIKVNIDVSTSQSVAEYVKEDKTIPTEPFVPIGQSVEELLRVPKGIEIKDGQIIDTAYEGKYGRYTIFTTKTGTKIHLKEGCCGANVPSLSFLSNGSNMYQTCDKCFPRSKINLLFIPEWYKDFREYKRKKNYKISNYENDFS